MQIVSRFTPQAHALIGYDKLLNAGAGFVDVIPQVLALLAFAVLTGRQVPFITGECASLILLVVLGMAMCSAGIGRVAAADAWTHPLAILGYLLGVVILIIAAAGIFDWQMPLITGARQAIIAVSLLSVAKLVISFLHRLLWS
jgi:hypothetical protein